MSVLTKLKKWKQQRQLQARHRDTLNRYRQQQFGQDKSTISLADALEKRLLDPSELYGSNLINSIHIFDARVWDQWNKVSKNRLNLYLALYGPTKELLEKNYSDAYKKMLPLEAVLENAAYYRNIELLNWLYENPELWRTMQWAPHTYLADIQVGTWMLDRFNVTDGLPPEHLRITCERLLNSELVSFASMTCEGAIKTHEHHVEVQEYIKRVFDALLPPSQWTWQQRWSSMVQPYVSVMNTQDMNASESFKCTLRGLVVSSVLNEAPVPIQKILCAFKNTTHPEENQKDVDAKLIRQHFFDGPPPNLESKSSLPLILSLLETVDPDVGVNTILPMLLKIDSQIVQYTINDFDF